MRNFFLTSVLCSLISVFLPSCQTAPVKAVDSWFVGHKTQFQASADLIAQEAVAIAEKTVYSKAPDATDLLAKNFNTDGFADALRSLEGGLAPAAISQIPDFVMKLRQIWLPSQTHYTDLAANVAQLIETKYEELHPKTDADRTAIIEGVIKGLQTPPAALVGP